jgi:hypothetical protein
MRRDGEEIGVYIDKMINLVEGNNTASQWMAESELPSEAL